MKKNHKLWIGIIVGVGVGVVTLGVLFFILFLLFLFGGPTERTTDITKYEETMSKYPYIQTGFISFPETIPDSATDADFYFSFKDTWDDPTCEVFLQCTYDEADYRAEVERLENTKKQYGSVERYLLRDEEGRFDYPAYIAIDANNYAYEYALLTGERQITYIYTSFMYEESLKKVEKKYLPIDYDSRKNQARPMEGYSIYLVQETYYNGEVHGWNLDYSREETVDVLEYHPVIVGYNWFTVCTCLDEEDNQIIQYCGYNYYDSKHDSLYGYPDEITYEELSGYQFKSVELNEDMTKAIVTYYDGDEEKKMEYEIPDV